MAQYKVISDRIADKQVDDVVSDDDLAGANVEALIDAGHIAPIAKSSKTSDSKKDE